MKQQHFVMNSNHTQKKIFFRKQEEPQERSTRGDIFSIEDAAAACRDNVWYSLFKIERDYIKELWKAIENRKQYTDLSPSACAYTEAPAEGIFSIYSRVTTGRERVSISNAVPLTRVALHSPPPATPEAAILAKAAMSNYKSQYGERYCTLGWKPGATSTTVKRIQSKQWDW